MKIKSIDFRLENLKLSKPYRIAFKTVDFVENLYCTMVFDNGIVGYGSCNPENEVAFISRNKTINSIVSLDQDLLKSIDIVHDPWPLIYKINKYIGNIPTLQAAMEIAVWDAFGKKMQKTILGLWGKKVEPISTSVTIGIMDIDDTLKETKEFLKAGFNCIKIKIGLEPESDVERIKKLLDEYGDKIILRADINQGYKIDDYKKFIALTKNLPIELHEQPLRRDQFIDLDSLSPLERKPIAADESLLHKEDAADHAKHNRCGIFNIKVMKCGAWSISKDIADIALHNNIDLMWGCNDESRLSISAAMNMAYACANTKYLDLDGSFDLAYDPALNGFEIQDGKMIPIDMPGFGVELEF